MREETRQLRAPAAWLLAGAVLSRGSGLVAGVLLASILGPERFGTFALVQNAAAFFAGVAGLGVGVALARQLAAVRLTSAQMAGRYLATAIAATLLSGTLVTVVYVASSDFFAREVLNLPGGGLLLAATGGVVFAALTGTWQGGLLGLEAFPEMAASQILQGVLLAVGLTVGALYGGTTGALLAGSAAYASAAVGTLGLLVFATRRRAIVVWLRMDGSTWKRLWPLAAPALVAFVTVYAGLLVSQIALSRQSSGNAELASFNLSYRWHLVILFIPTALAPLLMPVMTRMLAQRARADAFRAYSLQLRLNVLITAVPAVAVLLLAEAVLGLSGAYYRDNPESLRILALASVPSAVNNVLSSAALSMGAVRLWLLSDVVLAITLVGGALLLVPGRGADGLAWSFLAAYMLTDFVLLGGLASRLSALSGSVP